MESQSYDISSINQTELFGVNEKNLQFIKLIFPQLNITVRSQQMSVQGSPMDMERFSIFLNSYCRLITNTRK